MGFNPIQLNGKPLSIHKTRVNPLFKGKTVLVTDTWEYVDLWLNRANKSEARFYWQQSRSFYEATKLLPLTSAPLTAYYCFLNATKALLLAKSAPFSDEHGVTGFEIGNRTSLSNEKVKFKTGGILKSLSEYLGEGSGESIHTLYDLLHNLVYIHRAFDLTFSTAKELFIPIHQPMIVRSQSTHEAWFVAELRDKYKTKNTLNMLPNIFERELGDTNRYCFRRKQRFDWRPSDRDQSLVRYNTYHNVLRKHLFYIYGPQRLWYIKRSGNIASLMERGSLTITFAAMHRLSELSRYRPDLLAKHFECQHNWLLSEFIQTAPLQFIDEISSEMTGMEFLIPGRASNK